MSETRLATLNEAAELTGLSVDALRKRIKRGRLRVVRGNDGLVRVRLDEADIAELKADRPPSRPASPLAEESLAISGLQTAIEALRDQLARAEERETALRASADQAEARLDALLNDLRAERSTLQLLQTESAIKQRKLTERIAELEAQLAQQSEPADPLGPDADEISADLEGEGLPTSAWVEEAWGAGASNDHSSTADPAHQVERLWQRIEELEHRLEAAKAERAGRTPEAAANRAPEPAAAEPEPTERPRRWWRRLLQRRQA